MIVAYRGNHAVSFSTESHIAASIELLGHECVRIQENEVSWAETLDLAATADVFAWTTTYDYAHRWDQAEAHAAVDKLNSMLPTFGVHLDLWFGLQRQWQVHTEPFFRLSHVFTADGDHQDEFAAAGVNHFWLPPAVYGPECYRGTPRPEYASDVAFVGAWQHYGHPEWEPHRLALLASVRKHFGRRFRCWPERGNPAVRGADLNDVLASAKVVLGDSCLATTSRAYVSDRAFEVAGRGGALVFPYVPGLAELLRPDEHVRYYMPGDHDGAIAQIEWLLAHEVERRAMVDRAQAHVRATATYEHRVQTILDTLKAEGAL